MKGSHMKEEINNIHIESIIKDISPMGYGNFGSLEFDFEDSFILDAYIKN